MSEKENTKPARPFKKRFIITTKYGNAYVGGHGKDYDESNRLREGDVCIVKVGAAYSDGDLVVMRCNRRCGPTEGHYHPLYFRRCHGRKYSFRLARFDNDAGGSRYTAGGESIIVGPVLRVIKRREHAGVKSEKATGQKKGQPKRTAYRAAFNNSYFGLHKGDTLVVEESGEASVGSLILVMNDKPKDEDDSYFARVCSVHGETVRVCGSDGGESYDKRLSQVIGPLVEIKHDKCNQAKIKVLRDRIEALGEENDQIIRCTKRYELEKEIYDLEHPLEEEAKADFEWPEEVDDQGGAR